MLITIFTVSTTVDLPEPGTVHCSWVCKLKKVHYRMVLQRHTHTHAHTSF